MRTGLHFFRCLLGSGSQAAALLENNFQAGRLCWTWAGRAGRVLGEPCAELRHQTMLCFRHKVTQGRCSAEPGPVLKLSSLPRCPGTYGISVCSGASVLGWLALPYRVASVFLILSLISASLCYLSFTEDPCSPHPPLRTTQG